MNFEQRTREKFEHSMKLDAGEPKLRSAQVGANVGIQVSKSIHDFTCPQPAPISPVTEQIENLRGQLSGLGDLVDLLTNKLQDVLANDPRNQSQPDDCAAPPTSCRLESALVDVSSQLARHTELLHAVIRQIQL